MDWKSCAVDDLKRYNYIKIGILNSADRLKVLRPVASLGKRTLQKAAEPSDFCLLNAIVEAERLEDNIEASKKLALMIERGLETLDENERYVLNEFYIKSSEVNMLKLKEKLGYEARSIYRLRDRALAKFTLSMYGIQVF